MIWIILYMITGCIYCAYDIARSLRKHTVAQQYSPVTILIGIAIMAIIVAPLWPIWLGIGIASTSKGART